jgi:hypothetical protein
LPAGGGRGPRTIRKICKNSCLLRLGRPCLPTLKIRK